jgi:hypothetical protein
LGPIGYRNVAVIAFDAEPSTMISFAILDCASRFTAVTACVYRGVLRFGSSENAIFTCLIGFRWLR